MLVSQVSKPAVSPTSKSAALNIITGSELTTVWTPPMTTTSSPPRQPVFVTTRWSVVLAAGRSDTTHSRDALARLCQTYWYPLYAYVRRRGHNADEAQDLTQEFFARLLEKHSIASADPGRGRFRSFILTALNNFLAQEWEKARAQKRGGGAELFSLDLARAEDRYDLEPAILETPDKDFDKKWALALLETVMLQLEHEYKTEGKSDVFNALKQTLAGSRESQPYADLAKQLNTTEAAIKVTVHRLRKRYRELLQNEIANTVSSPEEIKEEMRHLFAALVG
ncbi:MAG: RNA polymerase sigma factor [Limisphaerales bacterium]